LQTKSGVCSLATYKLGDVFVWDKKVLKDEMESVKYHSKLKHLIWLIGSCRKCNCGVNGCAWLNQTTHVIEEIELHSYTVKLEPTLEIKDTTQAGE
jgi:hypothetical protein